MDNTKTGLDTEHISLVTHFAIKNGVSLLMNINCDVLILVLVTGAGGGGGVVVVELGVETTTNR